MTTDDRREQYERTMSGGFWLVWINQGDSENMLAQVESVASGKIRERWIGESPRGHSGSMSDRITLLRNTEDGRRR